MPAVVHHSPNPSSPAPLSNIGGIVQPGLVPESAEPFSACGAAQVSRKMQSIRSKDCRSPSTPGALAKESPQKGVDSLSFYIAKPATRPNKPPVKVSQKAKDASESS